jgi:hypothetical protein
MSPGEASQKLFRDGAIAATAMTGWGQEDRAGRYLRFVYANEPVSRLLGLRDRIRKAWLV